MRLYRSQHPDSNRLTLKRWYAKNRESAQHTARQRYYADPIKRFTAATNYSASRSGKPGSLARADIARLFPSAIGDFPAGLCVYCASIVAPGCNATLDHVEPAGLHEVANVVLSCTSCNSSRQTTPVEEFRQRLQRDTQLREHVVARNKAKVAGFLVTRYQLEIEDILSLVEAKRAQSS